MNTPSWLEEREAGIGASESAALLGLSPWATPLSLFLAKSGRLKKDKSLDEVERIQWGNLLEPVIIGELVARTRRGQVQVEDLAPVLTRSVVLARPHSFVASGQVREVTHYVVRRKDVPYIQATPDFAFAKWMPLPTPVEQEAFEGPGWGEAKNASVWAARLWKSGPPLYYQTQVQHQILAGHDLAWGCIGILVGGNQLRIVDQARNGPFQRYLEDKIGAFMELVRKDIPPPPLGTEEERQRIGLAFPEEAGSTAILPKDFEVDGAKLLALKKDAERLDAEISAIENKFRLAIGTASFAVVDGSRSCWSWKTTSNGQRRLHRMKDGSLVVPRKRKDPPEKAATT